jgi:[acyl-carrier-protein] S-malonyltransferase
MGKALYDAHTEVRDLYEQADTLLGFSLSDLCFNGPAEQLQQTSNAQPALLVTEIAHLTALKLRHPVELGTPRFVAGHSLGEYSALVAAEALSFEDALWLVYHRGRLMQQAGDASGRPTGMAAVLGIEAGELAQVCEAAGVDIANLNAPGQTVISGPLDALEKAGELAKDAGARRVVPLQVSAAFHSRWMRPMSEEFVEEYLAEVTDYRNPTLPVIANVTARPVTSGDEIPDLLGKQTYSAVRWMDSVEYMVSQGVNTFIEIGPGKVLSGLIKRIAPGVQALATEDLLG